MNLNKKRIGLVSAWLISLLIVATVVYVVYAQTASTFWITEGVYPSVSSVTIWRESSTYFVKDDYGQQLSYSSNITALFDSVKHIDGRIHFKAGLYEVDTRMTVNSELEISGEYGGASGGTIFKPTGNNDVFMISLDTVYEAVYMHDFSIIDSDQVQTSTSAIHIPVLIGENPRSLIFENLFIRYCYYGIVTEDLGHGAVQKYPHGVIKNVEFMNIRGMALRLHRSADWFVNNVMVDNANTVANDSLVSFAGSAIGITVNGLTILGTSGAGMSGLAQLEILGVLIYLNNIIIDGTPDNADGIWIASSAYHIYMNHFTVVNADDYGISINGAVGGIFLSEGNIANSGLSGIGINSVVNGTRPIMLSNLWLYGNAVMGIYAFGANSSKIYVDCVRSGDDFYSAPTQDYGINIAGGANPNEVTISNSDFRNNELMGIGGTLTAVTISDTWNTTAWIHDYPT